MAVRIKEQKTDKVSTKCNVNEFRSSTTCPSYIQFLAGVNKIRVLLWHGWGPQHNHK